MTQNENRFLNERLIRNSPATNQQVSGLILFFKLKFNSLFKIKLNNIILLLRNFY